MATFEQEAALPRAAESPRLMERRRLPFVRWFRELGWRHLVALAAVFFALFPVAWIVTSSINTVDSLTTVNFVPTSTTLSNYTALFEGCGWEWGVPPFECSASNTPFPLWLFNSVKIALIATTIQLLFSALAAYSFARLRWRGRRAGLISILLIQMFPQFLAFVAIFLLLQTLSNTFGDARQVAAWIVGLPLFVAGVGWFVMARRRDAEERYQRWSFYALIVGVVFGLIAVLSPSFGITVFPKIGLGTHTALVLVYLGGAIGVNTWLIKGFMDSIPMSLDEAAKVDGATDWDIFSRIVAPLARPILVVIFIITFVGLYNEFILAQILIRDVDQFTYATGMNLFIDSEYSAKWGQMTAAALIGSVPIIVLFLVMQDRIVSGLQGAVKG
jgi:ABC-type maltose transport system permease subunit